jgi:hypothetical protein
MRRKTRVKQLKSLFNIPQQLLAACDSFPASHPPNLAHFLSKSINHTKRKKRELIMMRNVIVNVWGGTLNGMRMSEDENEWVSSTWRRQQPWLLEKLFIRRKSSSSFAAKVCVCVSAW